jgi:protein-tyrosine phosphatase
MTDKLIELHFHCLPGLDDGPLTWDEAVALCRAAAKDGSTIIVATPHVLRYPWVNDDAAARDQRILKLNTLLGGKPKVLAGCEYLFSSDALELWDRGTAGPLTGLNRTDYLLTEFPWGIDVQNVSRFLYEFSLPGVTLVIAHPERQRDFIRDPGALEVLVKRGAIVQLTAGSFLGDFGDLPRKASFEFVERGLVHLVASDAHSLLSRPPRLAAAREFFEGRWGREVAAGIFEKNPEAVLKGKPLSFRLAGGGSEVETRKVFNSRYCLTWPANREPAREEPRVEVRAEPRVEVRAEPRVEVRAEPRVEIRAEPRVEAREEPRVEAREEPRVELREEPRVELREEPRVEVREEPRVEEEEPGRRDPASVPEIAAAVVALLGGPSPKVSSEAPAEPAPFIPALPSRAATTKSKPILLSSKQRKFYQRALAVSRKEIGEVQVQIHDEVAKAKDRVRKLQKAQEAARLMYDAGCMRLGIPNNLKGSEPQH